jgi:hypothetical protein
MLDDPRRVALVVGLGVLALAYNVWTYSSLWSSPNGVTARATEPLPSAEVPSGPEPAALAAAPLAEDEVAQIIAALPGAARDPFQFADPAPAAAPALEAAPLLPPSHLVLQGTLVGRRRAAWINQRALAEGELIDGHVLERIETGRVRLRRGDQVIELWTQP